MLLTGLIILFVLLFQLWAWLYIAPSRKRTYRNVPVRQQVRRHLAQNRVVRPSYRAELQRTSAPQEVAKTEGTAATVNPTLDLQAPTPAF